MASEISQLYSALDRLKSRIGELNPAESEAERRIGSGLANYETRVQNLRPWETQESVRREILGPLAERFGIETETEKWSGPVQLPGGKIVQIEINSGRAREVNTNPDGIKESRRVPEGVSPGFFFAGPQEGEAAARSAYEASPEGMEARKKFVGEARKDLVPQAAIPLEGAPNMYLIPPLPKGWAVRSASQSSGGIDERLARILFPDRSPVESNPRSTNAPSSFTSGKYRVKVK